MSSGGTTAAIATGAKGLSVKVERHQTRQRGGGGAEHQRRDQRHHGGEIDVPTQKAQRRRGGALAAVIHRAAEAETLGMLPAEPGRTATRLAGIRPGMQRATAKPAPCCPGGGRNITVEGEKLLMELGVGQHGLVHWVRPLN
jgi:hypothetical protein